MAKVEFNYKGIITVIQCLEDEKMEEIFKKFSTKINIDINNIFFLYSGKKINSQLTFSQIINEADKERKIISILVEELNSDKSKNNSSIIESKFPICPDCKEVVPFEIYDHKIRLDCKNGHLNLFPINEYKDYQKSNTSKIDIEQNNNRKNECISCENELCLLCSYKQDKKNKIINNDSKNYICEMHDELYISYCKKCKINICMKCAKAHDNHNIINFWEIIPDKDELSKKLIEFKNEIDMYKKYIEDLINKLINVKEKIEILYNIYYNMINNYDDKYRNYEIFTSLNSIKNNSIINDLKNINKTHIFSDKLEEILKLYDYMNYFEMSLEYNFNNNEEIQIFNGIFVQSNFEKCKIIYENKEYELTRDFKRKNKYQNNLEIKLRSCNNAIDLTCMFKGCESLVSIKDISKWHMNKIKDMSFMFNGCSSLESLPDISIWNTSKVNNFKSMFNGCSSLKSLPDISKWNTSQVMNLNSIFYECSSLKSIPDISKWDTSNVTNMEGIFYACKSLETIPDISKWDTNKVCTINHLFYGCTSLKIFRIYQIGIQLI